MKITEVYRLEDITDSSFVRVEDYVYYSCKETGELIGTPGSNTDFTPYSIGNDVLSLLWEEYDSTYLQFNGSSESLTGTWTRSKNKEADCKLKYDDYDDEYDLECINGWESVKAVFTQNTLSVTSDVCLFGDDFYMHPNTEEQGGWLYQTPEDCNTMVMAKGDKKITATVKAFLEENRFELVYKYNGKSCTRALNTIFVAVQDEACKIVAETGRDYQDVRRELLEAPFYQCLEDNNFPMELFSDEEESDSYAKVLARKISDKLKQHKQLPLF